MGNTYAINKEAFISGLSNFASNGKLFDVMRVKASNDGDVKDVEVLVVRWRSFYFDVEYLVLPVCNFVEKIRKASELLDMNKPAWSSKVGITAKLLGTIDMSYGLRTEWIDTIYLHSNVIRNVTFDKTDMFSFVFEDSSDTPKLIHTPIWCDKDWSIDDWSVELPDGAKFVGKVNGNTEPDDKNDTLLLDPIYPHVKYRRTKSDESELEDSDFEDDDDDLLDDCDLTDDDVSDEVPSAENISDITEDETTKRANCKRAAGLGILAVGLSAIALWRVFRKK